MKMKMKMPRFGYAAFFLATATATDETCNLDCNGAGTCMIGNADFSGSTPVINGVKKYVPFLHELSIDNQYCQCEPGYTGVDCSHKVESCNSSSEEGSLFKCFHDAKCVVGFPDQLGNDQYYCDCTTTKHHQGKKYAGPFCQYEEAERCTADGSVFCVNSGTCKTDASSKSNPCHCGEDFEGTHCEWEKGTMPNCDLECENNGECVLGFKSYQEASMKIDLPFLEKRHIDMMHCVCPEGFTGIRCEVEAGEECGDAKCYHGSKCVKTRDDEFCDCNTANDKDSSYSGRYCEYEALTWCTKDESINGQPFCVNGGTCREKSHEGCNCPDAFKGQQCEYKKEASMPQCTLNCSNDGKCRKGTKDFGVTAASKWGLDFLNKTHINYEYCVCPEGYTGLQCEYEVETCSNGEHSCLNGGTCIKLEGSDGKVKHACDCEGASTSTHKFAGLFCEHSSFSLCLASESEVDDMKDLVAFCTNGGTCKQKVNKHDSHPGCECQGDFKGDHCELSTNIIVPESVVLKTEDLKPACSMDCNGFGTCEVDNYDSSANNDNQYCKCDPGHTGAHCEDLFSSCNTPNKEGTIIPCSNGAQCVFGLFDKFGNEQYHCDCSTANHQNRKIFSGQYCHLERAERCTHDGSVFCVNGGICKENTEDNLSPCECSPQYEGAHCEWKQGLMPSCDLQCDNGGQCAVGFTSFEEVLNLNVMSVRGAKQIDMMHCMCPEGFTGDKCEIIVGSDDKCGDDKCHHGSECVKTKNDEFCDCRTAVDHTGNHFAGRYCENKATSWCNKMNNNNGREFCVNDGVCRKGDHKGCTCPDGFKGHQCEYKKEASMPQCTLNCSNDGKCRKGTKDFGVTAASKWGLDFLNKTHINYEYCVCPEGYTGLQCEYEVETCSNGEHSCLNGGTCVKFEGRNGKQDKHACDCEGASTSTHKFAGLFCEHSSTSWCVTGNTDDDLLNSFCTNGGTCKQHVKKGDTHPGCKCPTGFKGEKCELVMGITPPAAIASQNDYAKTSKGDGVKPVILAVLMSMCLAAYALFVNVKRRREDETSQSDSNHPIEHAMETTPGRITGFNPDSFSDESDDNFYSKKAHARKGNTSMDEGINLEQTDFSPTPVYII